MSLTSQLVTVQAYVVEDSRQLILEGQLHVALQTLGKETSSLTTRQVQHTQRIHSSQV